MSGRDYLADMRAVISAETSGGPYISAVVAEHIVEKLTATDPDLLEGWLRVGATSFLRHAINLRDCASRTRARLTAGRSVFAEAAEAFEAGDPGALSGFLATRYVVEDGSRVALAEMGRPHLTFVAGTYDARAAENAMTAAFLRALAKKVGRGTVADHFTEDQLAAMWASLSGQN